MVSPLFYLMAAAMVLMALASYRYNKILFLVEGTAAVLSGLAVLVSDVLYRRNISTTVRSAKRVLTGEEEAAFQAFALPVAVVAPAGDIVWANEALPAPCAAAGISWGTMCSNTSTPRPSAR